MIPTIFTKEKILTRKAATWVTIMAMVEQREVVAVAVVVAVLLLQVALERANMHPLRRDRVCSTAIRARFSWGDCPGRRPKNRCDGVLNNTVPSFLSKSCAIGILETRVDLPSWSFKIRQQSISLCKTKERYPSITNW
jgi:hypothetical protein